MFVYNWLDTLINYPRKKPRCRPEGPNDRWRLVEYWYCEPTILHLVLLPDYGRDLVGSLLSLVYCTIVQ